MNEFATPYFDVWEVFENVPYIPKIVQNGIDIHKPIIK